ncbi:MAG: putative lipid II flippase FtsW [Patescibacteria group bacterium]|nr:putative lipid II flippase FtsW [Patescibacteria group bacterium]
MMSRGSRLHHPDYFLMALVLVIVLFGFVMLASASSDLGKVRFNDGYYYLKHQALYGLSLGVLGFILGAFIKYDRYRKVAFFMLVGTVILLLLVFTPLGVTTNSATRWLQISSFRFQPAELLKLTFIIYLAAWLSRSNSKRNTSFSEGLLPFSIVSGLVGGLLILQPATSTVVILLGAGLVVYFLSGANMKHIGLMALFAVVCIGLIVYVTPYRRDRILGFIQHGQHLEGKNFQVNQALIAIGSGGFTGVGYGRSVIKGSLPASVDDSIFAIIGEELGFAGSGILILLFGMLVLRLFWLSQKAPNMFGRLMLVGFGTIIAFQSIVNMGAISGILPLTGVPLPFISYGGTALVVFLTMMGITVNVSRYT